MDASTPQNPKKPRLSRRLLSHFTLTLSVLLALSFVTLAVVGPTTHKAEAIAPIVIPAVLLGMAIGAYLTNYLSDTSNNAIYEVAATNYSLTMATGLKNSMSLVDSQLQNFVKEQDLLSYYYIRKAQWAARELWIEQNRTGADFIFDPHKVLIDSTIYDDFQTYMNATKDQFDTVFQSFRNVGTYYTGYFEGVSYALRFYEGSYRVVGATPAHPDMNVSFDFCYIPSYLKPMYYDGISDLFVNSGSPLWIVDKNGIDLYKVTKPSTGVRTYHTAEEINLSEGIYYFKGTNVRVGGNLIPVSATDMDAHSYYVAVNGSSTYAENLFSNLNLYSSSGYENDNDVSKMRVGFFPDGSAASYNDPNYYYELNTHRLNAIALMNEFVSVQTNVLNFAQSYYNTIVLSGDPGGAFDLPLMLMPDPSQMEGMDWQEIYALYVAYLQSAHDWYEDHAGELTPDYVNISANSLNLRIRGSIINETGVELFDNSTVWTPFITTDSVTLTIGKNDWDNTAYGVVWGNATNLSEFANPTKSELIDLFPGYTIYIQEILYNGTYVTELDLNVSTVEIVIAEIITPPGPPNIKQITDLEWITEHWYYIAIIGGVICLLGAIATRNMPILLAGLVLLAAGAGGWYLAGDTSLLDWLSMEPPNLRAWMQNLR